MSNLDDIKPGEKVRVTFEGELQYRDMGGGLWFKNGGVFREETQSLVTQIERIEPPIAIGDQVLDTLGMAIFTVIAEVERTGRRLLWLEGGPKGFETRFESDVRRIP